MELELKFNRTESKKLLELLEILESREDIKDDILDTATRIKENIASVLNLEMDLHEVGE